MVYHRILGVLNIKGGGAVYYYEEGVTSKLNPAVQPHILVSRPLYPTKVPPKLVPRSVIVADGRRVLLSFFRSWLLIYMSRLHAVGIRSLAALVIHSKSTTFRAQTIMQPDGPLKATFFS